MENDSGDQQHWLHFSFFMVDPAVPRRWHKNRWYAKGTKNAQWACPLGRCFLMDLRFATFLQDLGNGFLVFGSKNAAVRARNFRRLYAE
jgi:hypothetical protein